jgi:hypothetical protein
MVSGIRFFAHSGALGNTVASLYGPIAQPETKAEIFGFTTEAALTSVPNRMGFFGDGGAPSSPIIVGQFNRRTHITDYLGTDLGQMVNVRFTGASAAEVSGVPLTQTGHTLATIPQESGTLLMRFREPNNAAVVTQNGVFRAVDLDANHQAPDVSTSTVTDATIYASELDNTDGDGGDASWTQISDGVGGGSDLTLNDQAVEANVHDYHVIASLSPGAAGRKINFAFYVQLEFL